MICYNHSSFRYIFFDCLLVDIRRKQWNNLYRMKTGEKKSSRKKDYQPLVILGGGPGGLAVGYFARKNRILFEIHEGASRPGGNCVTLRQGDFLFDSGAHRFHDKIPQITEEIMALMGDDLVKIDVPSQIFFRNRLVDFPLSPLNLLRNLGIFTFGRAGLEVVLSRFRRNAADENFESFALRTYGKTLANLFLLNYSQKLWGTECRRLSPNVSGKRMKGLDLKTFLKEAVLGSKAKTEHLDGAFYYPTKNGIGSIIDKLEAFCGPENIRLNSRITRIFHDHQRMLAVESGGGATEKTPYLVSTLPINRFLEMMEPRPPKRIADLGRSLRFRNVVLVALFLDMQSITPAATVYFPGLEFPFSRLYEARNRNRDMSPAGKTSAVVEIPCQPGDRTWNMEDSQLVELVSSGLIGTGLVKREKIMGTMVYRMHDAYPVLEIGFEEKIRQIFDYLKTFGNLRISGRNGKFLYTHVHDMMQFGKEIIDEFPFH